jgi:hypothetical protein
MPAPMILAIGRKIRLYGCLGKHSAWRRGTLPGLPCGACPGHIADDESRDGVVPQAIPMPRGPSPEGMCYLMSARDWRHFSTNASGPLGRAGRWSLFMAISGCGTFDDGWSDGGWERCTGVAQSRAAPAAGARLAQVARSKRWLSRCRASASRASARWRLHRRRAKWGTADRQVDGRRAGSPARRPGPRGSRRSLTGGACGAEVLRRAGNGARLQSSCAVWGNRGSRDCRTQTSPPSGARFSGRLGRSHIVSTLPRLGHRHSLAWARARPVNDARKLWKSVSGLGSR